MAILLDRPPAGAPIKVLERAWLRSAVAYEQFDESLYSDPDWDAFAKELNDRRGEWSPYFRVCIPGDDYNVGTTASGLNWMARGTVAWLFYEEARKLYSPE